MAIKKIEKKYGTFLVLSCDKNNFDKDMNSLSIEIEQLKRFPFSNVFVEITDQWFPNFLKIMNDKSLKYKNIEIKNNKALIQF